MSLIRDGIKNNVSATKGATRHARLTRTSQLPVTKKFYLPQTLAVDLFPAQPQTPARIEAGHESGLSASAQIADIRLGDRPNDYATGHYQHRQATPPRQRYAIEVVPSF